LNSKISYEKREEKKPTVWGQPECAEWKKSKAPCSDRGAQKNGCRAQRRAGKKGKKDAPQLLKEKGESKRGTDKKLKDGLIKEPPKNPQISRDLTQNNGRDPSCQPTCLHGDDGPQKGNADRRLIMRGKGRGREGCSKLMDVKKVLRSQMKVEANKRVLKLSFLAKSFGEWMIFRNALKRVRGWRCGTGTKDTHPTKGGDKIPSKYSGVQSLHH